MTLHTFALLGREEEKGFVNSKNSASFDYDNCKCARRVVHLKCPYAFFALNDRSNAVNKTVK